MCANQEASRGTVRKARMQEAGETQEGPRATAEVLQYELPQQGMAENSSSRCGDGTMKRDDWYGAIGLVLLIASALIILSWLTR